MGANVPCINQAKWLGLKQAEEAERKIFEQKTKESFGWRTRVVNSIKSLVDKASAIVATKPSDTVITMPKAYATSIPKVTEFQPTSFIPVNATGGMLIQTSSLLHDGNYVVSMPPPTQSIFPSSFATTTATKVSSEVERQQQVIGQLTTITAPASNPEEIEAREKRLYEKEKSPKKPSLLTTWMHDGDDDD